MGHGSELWSGEYRGPVKVLLVGHRHGHNVHTYRTLLGPTVILCHTLTQPCPALSPPTKQEAEAAAGKQHAAAARSLEQLREELAAKAGEVECKIERGSKKAGKMPELAQMLAPFLG